MTQGDQQAYSDADKRLLSDTASANRGAAGTLVVSSSQSTDATADKAGQATVQTDAQSDEDQRVVNQATGQLGLAPLVWTMPQ